MKLRWEDVEYVQTRRERIENKNIREMVDIPSIEDKLRVGMLWQFGYIHNRPIDA